MQLQFSKKTVRCLDNPVREVKNAEITQELRLSDGMPDIGRILMSWGQVILRSKQWQAHEIALSGGVKVWALYLPEDGTQPRMTEGWLPFQLKWDVRNEEREGPVRMMPLLRYVDSRGISSRKMMLRAGVAVLAQGFCAMEKEVYVPEELPEDVQCLRKTYPVLLPAEVGEKTFLLDEDLELTEYGVVAEKLISYTVHPEIAEKRILSDKIAFKGNANLHLVFRNEEGKIDNKTVDLPFSQLIDLDAAYSQDARADIRFGVTDLEADIPAKGQLRIKCGLVSQYLICDRQILEVVDDAYSPHRRVDPEMTNLYLPVVLEEKEEIIHAEQILTGQGGAVADARFYPEYPSMIRNPEGTQLQMTGLYQLLCYGEDGALQSASARWNKDYQIPMDSSCHVVAMVEDGKQMQIHTDVDGLSVSNPVVLQLSTGTDQGIPMMISLEADSLQELDTDRPSLILRRAGQDTLWEIAKQSGSTVDAIRVANQLAEEPAADQMLLIPVS